MEPWFKGFKGSTIKTGDKTYMSKGKYNIINHSTIEITELPVGVWTNNYKTFLDNLLLDNTAILKRGTKQKGKLQIK